MEIDKLFYVWDLKLNDAKTEKRRELGFEKQQNKNNTKKEMLHAFIFGWKLCNMLAELFFHSKPKLCTDLYIAS